MDAARALHLVAAGDLAAWPALSRDLERRGDPHKAATALGLLRDQGHVAAAAQWLARAADAPDLQGLRAALLTLSRGWAASPLRALTQDLLSGAYRLIPAGSFLMGSPPDAPGLAAPDLEDEAQHPVELTRAFLLKATPITQAEWRAAMGDNPAHFQGDDRRPVEQVSWDDAARLCAALSTQTGGAYRLPTEAEWEYACRAGAPTPSADDLNALIDATAWCWDWTPTTPQSPQPVAQKQPNGWGLYDMLGNVWEWCQDAERASHAARRAKWTRDRLRFGLGLGPRDVISAASGGDMRMARGGAYDEAVEFYYAPSGWAVPSGLREPNLGLRPIASLR